jgi:hypothetical protein
MKEWPSQHWAAKQLIEAEGKVRFKWPAGWSPDDVTEEVSQRCSTRLETIVEMMDDLSFSKEEVILKWCEITATPLLNRIHSAEKVWA